ncbi:MULTISPECIES: hypothetical protein [unclassified Nocardia]|uniref:hypothetical protein n=1 Tax=unclassified Nocardia TaxID=2637762 RepID=UPI001CE3BAD1|nr:MULTISPECIES: hypothetical protein [unclassified Nocardia]
MVKTRRRIPLTLLGAGAVLAVGVAVAVTLVAVHGNGSHPEAISRTGSDSVTPAAPVAEFGAPATDLFGRRVDIPNNPSGIALQQDSAPQQPGSPGWLTLAPLPAAGAGVWQRVFDGPVVRFSSSDGPARIDGRAAVGFAHTPQGAALAAEQIFWRTNANPRDRDLLLRLVDVTPKYLADYDRLVAAGKVSDRLPDKLKPLLFASDAFRIEGYSDDSAKVRFARKARETVDGQPTWVGMRLAVVWRDGDWKLTAVTGDDLVQIESLRSIEGWTQW